MQTFSTGHPSAAHEFSQNLSADNTLVQVFTGKGNLHGIEIQNLDTMNYVYLQVFDAATTGAVTLGVTTPDYSLVAFPNTIVRLMEFWPIRFFGKGCVVAVTSSRTGAVAPNTNPTLALWFRRDLGVN